jgi:DNA-binding FadR family transcriptional regulator
MQNRTLGDKAAEDLIILIRERGYDVGEKIPNEYELSEQLGVSRNTVREAVRVLASRNILYIRQGAGTFISDKKGVADDPLGFSLIEDHKKLVEDLMQIRIIIEPQIAALAAQNATAQDVEILQHLCDEVEELISKGQDFTQKDMEFHAQIGICSQNIVMTNLIPVICEGITVFASTVEEQEFQQTIKSHREIFQSIKEGRSTNAERAMLFHLLYNRNRFIEEDL